MSYYEQITETSTQNSRDEHVDIRNNVCIAKNLNVGHSLSVGSTINAGVSINSPIIYGHHIFNHVPIRHIYPVDHAFYLGNITTETHGLNSLSGINYTYTPFHNNDIHIYLPNTQLISPGMYFKIYIDSIDFLAPNEISHMNINIQTSDNTGTINGNLLFGNVNFQNICSAKLNNTETNVTILLTSHAGNVVYDTVTISIPSNNLFTFSKKYSNAKNIVLMNKFLAKGDTIELTYIGNSIWVINGMISDWNAIVDV